jgi:hypothetical protein
VKADAVKVAVLRRPDAGESDQAPARAAQI